MTFALLALFLAQGDIEPVARVRDGDTIVMATGEVVRLENVDTPELRGQCEPERALAHHAAAFVAEAVRSGVALQRRVTRAGHPRNDRRGRTVARVTLPDGQDLGGLLIASGFARAWTGRREPWCYQAGGL